MKENKSGIQRVVVLGSGGHAKVLIEIIKVLPQLQITCILDSNTKKIGETFFDIPIIGGDSLLESKELNADAFVIGIGSVSDNSFRSKLYQRCLKAGLHPLKIIASSAIVSESAQLGNGVQILPGAVINSDAKIDENVIINTGAIIEHDCVLHQNVHVATGAKLAGQVTVGRDSFIGCGASIIQSVRIGEGAIVGAGAVVIRDVAAGATVKGNPAR